MCQFTKTYKAFKAATDGYSSETWFDWMLIPGKLKAASLYVHFFPQILLAWKKYELPYIEEETAVSTVIQYIIKNVDIIECDMRRYTPNYMYQITKNAIYPLSRIRRDIDHYHRRCSWYDVDDRLFESWCARDSEGEQLLYVEPWRSEKVVDTTDVLDQIIDRHRSAAFWSIVESLTSEELKFVERVINGVAVGKRLQKKEDEILSSLRSKFSELNI